MKLVNRDELVRRAILGPGGPLSEGCRTASPGGCARGESTSGSTRRPQAGCPKGVDATPCRGRVSVHPRTFPLWMIPLSRVKLPPESPVPLGAAGASVSAVVSRIPVTHAGRASGRGVGQTDMLLPRLGQGAFEVAGNLTEKRSMGR